MIKAAFFDIDGTLVGFRHTEISEETVRSLDALRSRGVKLFICSGRAKQLITNVRNYPFDGYILMNGAIVEVGGKIISVTPIDRKDAMAIARISDENGFSCVALWPDGIGVNVETEAYIKICEMIHVKPFKIIDMEKTAAEKDICQYSIYVGEEVISKFYSPGTSHVLYPRWHPAFCDAIPDKISKGEGVGSILKLLGLSKDEAIAFGDGGNDIPMLDAVGTGVAMGNSAPDVKEHADFIAGDADNEGVSLALKDLGLI
jgi:Cof subfamily protein (haloacid dehalogenase superfamily)